MYCCKALQTIPIVAMLFVCQTASAQNPWIQWTASEGGNDHWYRLTNVEGTWAEAEAEAEAVRAGAHLVTINNADENQWVYDTFSQGNQLLWVGFFQDHNDPNYSEPNGGWKWVGAPDLCSWQTGNPSVCYVNWRPSEPNANDVLGSEDFVEMLTFAPATWNDVRVDGNPKPGVIEWETAPSIPAVSSWGLIVMALLVLTTGTLVCARRRPTSD